MIAAPTGRRRRRSNQPTNNSIAPKHQPQAYALRAAAVLPASAAGTGTGTGGGSASRLMQRRPMGMGLGLLQLQLQQRAFSVGFGGLQYDTLVEMQEK